MIAASSASFMRSPRKPQPLLADAAVEVAVPIKRGRVGLAQGPCARRVVAAVRARRHLEMGDDRGDLAGGNVGVAVGEDHGCTRSLCAKAAAIQSVSSRRRPGPITTSINCFAPLERRVPFTTSSAEYGSRPSPGRRCVCDRVLAQQRSPRRQRDGLSGRDFSRRLKKSRIALRSIRATRFRYPSPRRSPARPSPPWPIPQAFAPLSPGSYWA